MIRGRVVCFRSLCTLSVPIQNISKSHVFQSNKTIQELAKVGRVTEARTVFDTMSQRDSVSWNSMIYGYVQNGMLHDAQSLFNAFHGKNVRTWTTLLTGYAKAGLVDEARAVFDLMPERNVVSWNAMMSGYVQNGELRKARELFDQMPERNESSWNSMITGYCRSGMMREARELFDCTRERNFVTWMVLMSGYVEISEYQEAWSVFLMMLECGMMPGQSLLVVALSAITGLNDLQLLESLRTMAMKLGYGGDVVVGTAILNGYSRYGSLNAAIKFFEAMPEQNEYTWTTMISALSQCGRFDDAIALYNRLPEKGFSVRATMITTYAKMGRIFEAKRIFDETPNPDVITWNAIVAGYCQNGMLEAAKYIFLQIPVKKSTSWAAMIAGFVQGGESKEGLELFSELHRLGNVPSHSCFTSALFACANDGLVEAGKQIHSLTIKTGCQFNSYVGNGLISMYAKCRNPENFSQAFSTMMVRDTVSWNSYITGLSENHMLDDARNIFDKMPKRDVVSWTAIISAYVQAGQEEIAVDLFLNMLAGGMRPEESTITSLLSACGSMSATRLGEQIHALILKFGYESCLYVGNALITMYFKCGSLDALDVFEQMTKRDIVTWNAVLAGCAQNGLGNEAVKFFEQMKAREVLPNEISFVGVLCACSHAGLVDEGWEYFNSMSEDYGITPLVHHYTCMVDLLGRAGQLTEAEDLVEKMPVQSDCVIWDALLAACRIHRNMELGQRVAERLFQMGTLRSGTYVLLSNIYASQGMWNKVGEIREMMKERGVIKEPGISRIQIKSKLHYFLMGDKTHNEFEEIHLALQDFYEQFRATGYVPDTNFVLHDVEEEQKENELLYHSEKLAVVYGVLRTPTGMPIQIMKNLRTCGDCHSFMKFLSNSTQRKIIIRDGNRFHHIENGSCSCGDYW